MADWTPSRRRPALRRRHPPITLAINQMLFVAAFPRAYEAINFCQVGIDLIDCCRTAVIIQYTDFADDLT
jgi:hypothetical protein